MHTAIPRNSACNGVRSVLNRKYEKSKSLLLENKQTSSLVAAELDQVVAQVSREQQRYDMLQQYAEDTMQRCVLQGRRQLPHWYAEYSTYSSTIFPLG